MPPRDKIRQHNSQSAIAQAFDERANALVVLPSEPAGHYVDTADGVYHSRAIAADDNAPNTVAPTTATQYARTMGDAEAFFHVELVAGTATDVEVWVYAQIGGATIWLLVERFPAVESLREYRCRVNYRMSFFRCVNTVGLAANPATLRATGA